MHFIQIPFYMLYVHSGWQHSFHDPLFVIGALHHNTIDMDLKLVRSKIHC